MGIPYKKRRDFKMKNPEIEIYHEEPDLPPRPVVNKGGRPPKQIDEKQVELLASYDCTAKEIAVVVGCHIETIYARFSEALKRGREQGNASIKRKLYELAMNGNLGALMWIAKNRIGYKDSPDEGPQMVQFNIQINEIPK